MRKIVMMNRITLDGYYTTENREIDWFIHDQEVDIAAHEMMNPDTLLMGRYTYKMFERVWRPVLEDPNVDAHRQRLATELRDLDKIVFSRTLNEVTWENSTIATDDIVMTAKNLKQNKGRDIAMFGSGEIAKVLINANLLDEYILVITPIIIGRGKSFLNDVKRHPLQLLDCRHFSSGNIIVHYKQI